jgi:uncharacterized membrane protein YiaA
MSHAAASLLSVAVLVAVHLTAGYVDRWQGRGRDLFLSAAAGVTVSYVVMQLLPALSRSDEAIRVIASRYLPFLERHGYFLAVVGIVVFYANANQVEASRRRSVAAGGADRAGTRAFIASMIVMGVFNLMVAYSLADPTDQQVRPLVLFVVAIGLYYLVADATLHSSYAMLYRRYGRWILSAALLVGWALGTAVRIPPVALSLLVAFFAGGTLATTLGTSLRPGPQSRVRAFAAGALLYALLLMGLRYV